MENNNSKDILKKYSIYIISGIIFLVAKYLYKSANSSDLDFILRPTNYLISFIIGIKPLVSSEGYYYSAINVLVNKSCSGFNFFLLCFIMLAFLSVKYVKSYKLCLLSIPSSILLSYFITILANTSRIVTSIFINTSSLNKYQEGVTWVHKAEGSFIYLFFLISIYLSVNYLFQHYEKSIKS